MPEAVRGALADPAADVRFAVDHPSYRAEASAPPDMRRALLADLGG